MVDDPLGQDHTHRCDATHRADRSSRRPPATYRAIPNQRRPGETKTTRFPLVLTIAAHPAIGALTGLAAQSMLEMGQAGITLWKGRDMSTYPPPGPGPGGLGQRIEEAIELIEMELRHAAAYVNDAVLPQVRSESITALRNVASALGNLAERLDRQQAGQQARQQPPPQPPNPAPPQAGDPGAR